MNIQHLSDEAVAACADGVLGGLARDRAQRHIAACRDCAQAVRVQREATFELRAASAPSLPLGLADRLRNLPQTTPVHSVPTAIGPDGATMLATFAPMSAALVAEPRPSIAHRTRPVVFTAAAVALAGAMSAASGSPVGPTASDPRPAHAPSFGTTGPPPLVTPVGVFRRTTP